MTALRNIEEGRATTAEEAMQMQSSNHTTSTRNSTNSESDTRKTRSTSVIMSIDRSMMSIMNDDDDSDSERKQDPFFRCCDLVKTCIIVDIIHVISTIIGFVVGYDILKPIDLEELDYEEGDYMPILNTATRKLDHFFLVVQIVTYGGIFFALVGIYGAARFNKYATLAAAIAYSLGFIGSCVLRSWIVAVLKLVFAYPHFVLYNSLHKGKLSRKNYDEEKYCCCCKDDDEE